MNIYGNIVTERAWLVVLKSEVRKLWDDDGMITLGYLKLAKKYPKKMASLYTQRSHFTNAKF
jgi:hypothetical protein